MSQGRKITFYIGDRHKDFYEKFWNEIEILQKNNVEFSTLEDPDLLLPVMCVNGGLVAGQKNISEFISHLNDQDKIGSHDWIKG